jgi:pentapeptide MXKDX repeat protein
MVRRFTILALSLSLLLGLTGAHHLFAQADAKKDEAKKEEPKKEAEKTEAKKEEVKKEEPKKEETKKEATKKEETKKEESLPPIPPEVEKKLEAARRAVAEAIVAAQDAGLVKSSIDPPPILDILITGRATDEAALKATPKTGVSPEVFGAWFTGYGKTQGIVPQSDVRIIQPSAGLKTWYDQRASFLTREIDAVRKAKGTPAPAKAEAKKEETKKEEVKKEEPKYEEPKKEETKKEEVKKEEPKKEEPKK